MTAIMERITVLLENMLIIGQGHGEDARNWSADGEDGAGDAETAVGDATAQTRALLAGTF